MTEKEMEEAVEATVRRTIVARPGLSPESIADIIAGKQKRDLREVEAAARGVARHMIGDILRERNTTENKEELVGKVANQAQLDLDAAEVDAMAWLYIFRLASRLLSQ